MLRVGSRIDPVAQVGQVDSLGNGNQEGVDRSSRNAPRILVHRGRGARWRGGVPPEAAYGGGQVVQCCQISGFQPRSGGILPVLGEK